MSEFKQPVFDFNKLFAGLFIYMAYLVLLVGLRTVANNAVGSSSTLLNTAFIVLLTLYVVMLIVSFVLQVIHLLKWLTFKATTPKWLAGGNK